MVFVGYPDRKTSLIRGESKAKHHRSNTSTGVSFIGMRLWYKNSMQLLPQSPGLFISFTNHRRVSKISIMAYDNKIASATQYALSLMDLLRQLSGNPATEIQIVFILN